MGEGEGRSVAHSLLHDFGPTDWTGIAFNEATGLENQRKGRVPSTQEWIAERPLVAWSDGVSLLSLAQAARSRFGLRGAAAGDFIRECIAAMLRAGAKPLLPTGQEMPVMKYADEWGNLAEDIVASAMAVIREQGEAAALGWGPFFGFLDDDCFFGGSPDRAPTNARYGRPKRPGSETQMVEPKLLRGIVSKLVEAAFSQETPPGYPGLWFHMLDGGIVGYYVHPECGWMLQIIRPGRQQSCFLPLTVHAWIEEDDPIQLHSASSS